MLNLLKHDHFLHYLPRLALIAEALLVDTLDSAEALCQLVYCQINFTKGTFSENLTDTIKLDGGLRSHGRRLFKAEADHLYQLSNTL